MEAKASIKFIKISPFKVRLVVDLIRNLPVVKALNILSNTHKGSAKPIMKLLRSCISNATNNNQMDANKLYISKIYVNPKFTIKRISMRAKGRSDRIKKRTSEVCIFLSDEKKIKKTKSKKIKKSKSNNKNNK